MDYLIDIIGSLATILSLLGAYLVTVPSASTRNKGFIVWLVSNTMWIAYGLMIGSIYTIILFAAYNGLSGKGAYSTWKEMKGK